MKKKPDHTGKLLSIALAGVGLALLFTQTDAKAHGMKLIEFVKGKAPPLPTLPGVADKTAPDDGTPFMTIITSSGLRATATGEGG